MSRTPRALLFAALLTTSGLLAACGDDGAEDVATDDPAASTTSTTADSGVGIEGGSAGSDAIEVTGAAGEKPVIELNDAGAATELYTEDLIVGEGDEVGPGDTVEAHYVGVQLDGTQFDASWDRGAPIEFSLNEVIAGWGEAIPGMKVGGRRLLVIPSDLAYGPDAAAQGRPEGTLVFVVDIVSIPFHAPDPIDVVGDGSGVVTCAPGAIEERPAITLNGAQPATELVTTDVIEGEGDEVTAESTVTVNYVGALLDGTVFDETWDDGLPATFEVGRVIDGFEQGLVGMRVGGRRLLVIPSALGYGAAGNGPIGPDQTLVFVVDIVEIAS